MTRPRILSILTPAGLLVLGACAAPAPAPDAYAAGKDFLARNQLGMALQSFRQAVHAEGRSVRVLNAMGAVHDAMGRADAADSYYREALTIAPGDVQTMNNLGYSLLLRKRARDAAELLTEAAARAPDDPLIARNLSLAVAEIAAEEPPPPKEPPKVAPTEPDGPPVRLGPWIERSARAVVTLRTDVAAYRKAIELDAEPEIALPAAESPPVPVPVAAALAPAACGLELANGNGRDGAAARLRANLLQPRGVTVARLTNAASFAVDHTVISYAPGCLAQAARLAALMPTEIRLVPAPAPAAGVRMVLGRDLLPFDRTTEA